MSKLIDLAGQRFGRWLVLAKGVRIRRDTYWLCRCDCGTERMVQGATLRRKGSRSCGCLKVEEFIERKPWEMEKPRLYADTPDGMLSAKEAARRAGIPPYLMRRRIKLGLPLKEIMAPRKRKRRRPSLTSRRSSQ